jgi:hypothetical protein
MKFGIPFFSNGVTVSLQSFMPSGLTNNTKLAIIVRLQLFNDFQTRLLPRIKTEILYFY